MKIRRLILPLICATTMLAGCAEENTNTEIAPGITQADIDFNGYKEDGFEKYVDKGYSFEGIFMDTIIGDIWVTANNPVSGTISPDEGELGTLTFKFKHDGIFKVEDKVENGNAVKQLIGLKTGGTVMQIYDGTKLIVRTIVNCRKALTDDKALFTKIAQADYWDGMFAKISKGSSKLLFSEDEETNLNTIVDFSYKEPGEDLGMGKFKIDLSSKVIMPFYSAIFVKYAVTVITPAAITPIEIHISATADLINLATKGGLLDQFLPVYNN